MKMNGDTKEVNGMRVIKSGSILTAGIWTLMLFSASAFGWGIVAPNGPQAFQYFQVKGVTLFQYDCLPGEEPTGTSCARAEFPRGNYPRIREILAQELKHLIEKLDAVIEVEELKLKDKDPEVITLRNMVQEDGKAIAALIVEKAGWEKKKILAEINVRLMKEQLKIIAALLAQAPPEPGFTRLATAQAEYEAKKIKHELEVDKFDTEVTVISKKISALLEKVKADKVTLKEYLADLTVTSPQLEEHRAIRDDLKEERELLPELDARLTQPVAYNLGTWDDPGAPELFARLMEVCRKHKE